MVELGTDFSQLSQPVDDQSPLDKLAQHLSGSGYSLDDIAV